jgi:hypothetical protein
MDSSPSRDCGDASTVFSTYQLVRNIFHLSGKLQRIPQSTAVFLDRVTQVAFLEENFFAVQGKTSGPRRTDHKVLKGGNCGRP